MDDVLSQALAPVLRDLQNSGLPGPRIEDWPSPTDPNAMLRHADGSGAGISVSRSRPVAERIAAVADQVQEWVFDDLWSAGLPTNWPACPGHPTNHPLVATIHAGVAVWVCPDDHLPVHEIGEIASYHP